MKKIDEPTAKEKKQAAVKSDTNTPISDDDIRQRAYEIYLKRGGLYAPPEADWLQAEAELRNSAYRKKREENNS